MRLGNYKDSSPIQLKPNAFKAPFSCFKLIVSGLVFFQLPDFKLTAFLSHFGALFLKLGFLHSTPCGNDHVKDKTGRTKGEADDKAFPECIRIYDKDYHAHKIDQYAAKNRKHDSFAGVCRYSLNKAFDLVDLESTCAYRQKRKDSAKRNFVLSHIVLPLV